ncbi:hypothetical protein K458DRAFT_285753 [Lentithecium fluviatile CBS 122367]|uniref:Uncharacterized protein n=1 Tax=Lentithecium fluviatile CBS 122367 TaxID=1168545 RepID=A0A6G1JMM4_9PLEO|nr:hypothetical protein K458DRAFT_285753 [Lentithecium fluviatile CBS 122367]
MDSRNGRKRPWEDDSPIESQFRRRDPSTGSVYECTPPLPQHADRSTRDSDALGCRRLPPLYTPSCNASAMSISSTSTPLSTPVISPFRTRSHSLIDVSLRPARQWSDGISEPTQASPRRLERDRSPLAIGSDAHRPRLGTGMQPHTARGVICCPSNCRGQECLHSRVLIRSLATELILLDSKVRSLSPKEYLSSTSEPPDFEDSTLKESLRWTLDLAQWINFHLRDHSDHSDACSPDQTVSQPSTSAAMRRGQQHLEQREEQSPPTRQYAGPHHGFISFAHPAMTTDQTRSNAYGGEIPPNTHSPHRTASSSGSVFMPSQSSMHAPQPSRPGMLPSPSSLSLSNATNLPSISPPSTAVQASAQATHLQDLQHQISVKSLAFQTLQSEYDSLLQKLERQRTKCATLEKKFEVSDVEINSLTDEKEKLHAQVAVLESQVEELQQSRDEARNQLVANGAQYMRIMEMANRLQAQSTEDKRRWEAEKAELQKRIKILEEAMVTGAQRPVSSGEEAGSNLSPSIIPTHIVAHASASSSSAETIKVLRAEISRLRLRSRGLETALQTMREESVAIQEAAKSLVESGNKMEKAAQGSMGD